MHAHSPPLSKKSFQRTFIVYLNLQKTKRFFREVAVEGLDIAMFEGQILALLGHNGAGKSTSINMFFDFESKVLNEEVKI